MTKAKAKAKEILDLYWDSKFPINAHSIASKLGLSVKYFSGESEKLYSGEYIANENGKPVIYINRNDSMPRQNFTLAHEIGHHVLNHGSALRDTERTILSVDPKEREANVFAANLLMPDSYVKKAIEVIGVNSVDEMAEIFSVSAPAIRIKMKELGY